MDTPFDFLDERMIADDAVHIIQQSAGSLGKSLAVSFGCDEQDFSIVREDDGRIFRAYVTEGIDGTFSIKQREGAEENNDGRSQVGV